jgi:ribonucleoside-diphosphate reductase alpha chain
MKDMLFSTALARENWESKYRYGSESPLETFQRVATHLASVEEDKDFWYEKFLNVMIKKDDDGNAVGLKNTFGGRITANAGTEYGGATMINCYINGPIRNASISYEREAANGVKIPVQINTQATGDSLSNIMLALLEQAETLKSEGGYGINFGFIRPRGSVIHGVGIRHPGVIHYMDIWDKVASVIVMGDNDGYKDKLKNYLEEIGSETVKKLKRQARKGAQMAVLPIWHPDIEEFIRAKQEPGRLTKFNISVLVDDAFMNAVDRDEFYDLTFNNEVYKRVRARELYDLIMESTYRRAEPGVLFYDNMQANNPLAYLGTVEATNPCFASDQRIFTKDGASTFGDLYNEGKELLAYQDLRVSSDSERSYQIDNKKSGHRLQPTSEVKLTRKDSPILKVCFNDGNSLRVTPDHIIMTPEGGVEAQNLIPGQKVLSSFPTLFEPIKNHRLSKLAFLLGMIDGDGCVVEEEGEKYLVNIDIWDDNVMVTQVKEMITELWEDFGEVISQDQSRPNMTPFHVRYIEDDKKTRISSSFIYRLLKKEFSWEGKKKIPSVFFSYSRDTNLFVSYVSGIFYCDGTVNIPPNGSPSFRISQSDKDYLSQLQVGFQSIGIPSSVYSRRPVHFKSLPDGKGGVKDYLTKEQFELIVNKTYFAELLEHVLIYAKHTNKYQRLEDNKIVKSRIERRHCKVVSVVPDGVEDVFCVVEDSHRNIIVNGVSVARCGEVPGNPLTTTVCLLGSINLTQYVNKDRKFDWNQLEEDIPVFLRALDNVNDLSYNPLPHYDWATRNVRQVGMGINGLGSAFYMMGIKFNSEEGFEFLQKLSRMKENLLWKSSALLAKEKGAFPAYTDSFIETNWFTHFADLDNDVADLIREYGVRNGKVSMNAPNGNCVLEDTIIQTNKGNLKIREIFERNGINPDISPPGWYDISEYPVSVLTMHGYWPVNRLYLNGKAPVVNLEMSNGESVSCTSEHRYLVRLDEKTAVWKYARDIVPGDKILKLLHQKEVANAIKFRKN